MAIELHHKDLGVTITVQTEKAAEVYKASGWSKATRKQADEKKEA